MATVNESEWMLAVDDSMIRNTTYDLEGDFRAYRQMVSISQGIKKLKEEKPRDYKKMVCRFKHEHHKFLSVPYADYFCHVYGSLTTYCLKLSFLVPASLNIIMQMWVMHCL